jgi:hypothetical protein
LWGARHGAHDTLEMAFCEGGGVLQPDVPPKRSWCGCWFALWLVLQEGAEAQGRRRGRGGGELRQARDDPGDADGWSSTSQDADSKLAFCRAAARRAGGNLQSRSLRLEFDEAVDRRDRRPGAARPGGPSVLAA